MGLDWSDPVRTLGQDAHDWLDQLVPHWAHILSWVHVVRGDPLVDRDWRAVCERFDAHRTPLTAAQANEWFRELVVGVWGMLDRWKARRLVALVARSALTTAEE